MKLLGLKSKVIIMTALLAVVRFSACFAEDFAPFKGQVKGDDVNVRADSTISAQELCRLTRDQVVDVISESYEWYRIRLPEQADAYIRKDMAACIDRSAAEQRSSGSDYDPLVQSTAPAVPQKTCDNIKVLKTDVNIRLEPSINSWIVGRVNENEVLQVLGESGDWYKIKPPDNSFGWVHRKFITKAVIKPPVKIVKAARGKVALMEDEQTGSIIITGNIQPYGRVFFRKATHKLVTDDKKVFLLKGQNDSLNALIGRRAKVMGVLMPNAKAKFPLIEVRSLEDVSTQDAQDQGSPQ